MESQGRRILHLELGRPDFDTPEPIKLETIASLGRGEVHYASNRGRIDLRRAIADRFEASRGVVYDAETEVVITSGVAEALLDVFLAFLDPDGEVIVPEPAWPHYRACAALAGGRVVEVPTLLENGFLPDPAQVAAAVTDRTQLLVINSPNNPTGAIYPPGLLKELGAVAERHDLLIVSDEIYGDLVYAGSHTTIARQSPDRTVIIDGLSKSHSMTGWRIGYAMGPRALIDPILRVHQYNTVCVSTFSQAGAATAFSDEVARTAAEMLRSFERRRHVLVDGLRRVRGFQLIEPSGAFYVFPRITGLGLPAAELAERLLEETGVATVPGSVFGSAGRDHLRLSFAAAEDDLAAAVRAITGFVEGLRP